MKKHRAPAGAAFPGIALILAVFSACTVTPMGGWEYKFDNQTDYTITLSLNANYKLSAEKEAVEYGAAITLPPKSNQTVYVESDSLGFEWTALSSNDNRYIYPETEGSKVTFRERAE